MGDYQIFPEIFYDTISAIEYEIPDIEKPDFINLFSEPLSEHKGYELTNMKQSGHFKNIFDVEEIRADYEISGLSAVALTYIEFLIGCTCYIRIPLTLLNRKYSFPNRKLRIMPNQNFTVRLNLPKGVRKIRYCTIGLKGDYHIPVE